MQRHSVVMLQYTVAALSMLLVNSVNATGQNESMRGALPPPGPYMSSRPVLMPTPVPVQEPGAMQPRTPMMPHYPTHSMMPPGQQMPRQPMYGYSPGMLPQGYSPVMPPFSNTMPYGSMPNRYSYPQPSPWQQPGYVPQQGGWRW
jgi:hypothetical protein